MKKMLIVALLVAAIFLPGCTYTESFSERNRRIVNVWRWDTRGIVEDFDMIMLLDRNSYMTQWHPWAGI